MLVVGFFLCCKTRLHITVPRDGFFFQSYAWDLLCNVPFRVYYCYTGSFWGRPLLPVRVLYSSPFSLCMPSCIQPANRVAAVWNPSRPQGVDLGVACCTLNKRSLKATEVLVAASGLTKKRSTDAVCDPTFLPRLSASPRSWRKFFPDLDLALRNAGGPQREGCPCSLGRAG